MVQFYGNGFMVAGELFEYYVSDAGVHMARIRMSGGMDIDIPVSALSVEQVA